MKNVSKNKRFWRLMQSFALRWAVLFVVSFPFSFSFPRPILPDAGRLFSPFFEKWAAWTGRHLFGLPETFSSPLISDSKGLYLHSFNLFLASFFLAIAWTWLSRKRGEDNRLRYGFIVFVRYYLAFQLLVYGFNKVFKWQFYLPEPNLLFTPLGDLHRDILFWSAMGSSYTYTVFSGIAEVIPALLLLFRPTRRIGALIAAGVMLNVVAINFSFDISVKLLSSFLLLLSLIAALPLRWQPHFSKKWIYFGVKTAVISLLLIDSLFPYLKTGNYNDDWAPRPVFHGAWEVEGKPEWRRLFVHRRGYLVVQDQQDKMQDYGLSVDTIRGEFIVEEWENGKLSGLAYRQDTNSTLVLEGDFFGDSIQIQLKKLELHTLPLMQKEFHWTID
jgi:uncharacterized membrane protein YphA (DoxX/SURF4 family)